MFLESVVNVLDGYIIKLKVFGYSFDVYMCLYFGYGLMVVCVVVLV